MNSTLLYPQNSNSTQQTSQDSMWNLISDQVMGGVSQGVMQDSGQLVNMQGNVSLKNNGGFLQLQTLIPNHIDAQQYQGIVIEACSESPVTLQLLIKSSQLWMPWQSYRAQIQTESAWQVFHIPFSAFQPYKTRTQLKPKKMTKFAVLAGGEAMQVNASIKQFGFYQ